MTKALPRWRATKSPLGTVSVVEPAPEGYSGRSFGGEESMKVGLTVTEEREVQKQRPWHLLLVAQQFQGVIN